MNLYSWYFSLENEWFDRENKVFQINVCGGYVLMVYEIFGTVNALVEKVIKHNCSVWALRSVWSKMTMI